MILGQTVHLYCLFELKNGTDLYTLKWFKDGAEFYRSVPRASVRKNRRLIFPRPGVKVDFENSKVSTTYYLERGLVRKKIYSHHWIGPFQLSYIVFGWIIPIPIPSMIHYHPSQFQSTQSCFFRFHFVQL